MKPWISDVVLAGALLAGVLACSKTTTQPTAGGPVVTPGMQLVVNIGARLSASVGCAFIAPADRGSALAALDATDAVVKVDPAKALSTIEALAGSPGPAQLWSVLHGVLNDQQVVTELAKQGLTSWTQNDWFQLASGAMSSAVQGCRSGLGAPA